MKRHKHSNFAGVACGFAILATAWVAFLGCDSEADRRDRTGRSTDAAAAAARIVISGDTTGWITPCGCTSNQSGGLARRATYLNQLRKSSGGTNVLYVDVGGAPGGSSAYQRVRFEAIMNGEEAMDVSAHNIGRAEAMLGGDYLVAQQARMDRRVFVSANVRSRTGTVLFDASRVMSAGDQRVLVVGVLSQRYAKELDASLQIIEPRQAVLDARAAQKGQFSSMLVLAYMPDDELAAFAASLPEADAVVGGPTGQALAPRQIGPTLLAAATNKGKFLIELTSGAERAPWTGTVIELSPSFADEEAQLKNVRAYQSELGRRDFIAADTGLVPALPNGTPATYRFVGSESCRTCHQQTQSTWDKSKHAHSILTVRERGFDVDPNCQQCHTTGFGMPGGFESLKRSPAQLLAVGCESCHGPSAEHVSNPKLKTPFAAADQCVRCHDHENSPTFKYEVYWPRIAHGREPSQPTSTKESKLP